MRIGEIANATGITTKTLRFYEERGLLPAAKRASNGYREYDEVTFARLDFIRRGQTAGLTLNQIQDIFALHDSGVAACMHVQETLAKEIENLDDRIADLISLRDSVIELHKRAESSAGCDETRICSYV